MDASRRWANSLLRRGKENMGTRLKGRLSLLLLSFAAVMLIFPTIAFAQDAGGSTTSTSPAPTIQSDQEDYPPGATVTLTGSNWKPGEKVNIFVNDDAGQTWSRNVDVYADANGQIQDQFQLPDWFVALYSVTATGETSGVAKTTFTDGTVAVRNATTTPVGLTVTYKLSKYNAIDCNQGSGTVTDTRTVTRSSVSGNPNSGSGSASISSGGTESVLVEMQSFSPSGTANFQQFNFVDGNTSGNGAFITNSTSYCMNTENNTNRTFIGVFNRAPAITLPGGALNYTENEAPKVIDSGATVTDADSANFDTGKLTVDFSANGTADDRLDIRNGGMGNPITLNGNKVVHNGTEIGTFTGGTGTTALEITLNANATPARIQDLARNITYANVSDDPSTAARTVRFVLTDGDGGTSTAATKQNNVTAVNDAPTITLPGPVLNYTENDPAGVIDSLATASDPDSPNFDTGTLTIDFLPGNGTADDRLEIRNQGTAAGQIGVSGSNVTFGGTTIGTFTGGSGTNALVITFDADATPTAVQALMRNITYRNVSDAPTPPPARFVRFVLTDGDGGTSNPAQKPINVTAVNDAPVNSVPGAQSTNEDTALTFKSANSNLISISDVDAGSNAVQVRLEATNGKLTLLGNTSGLTFAAGDSASNDNDITFTGPVANINSALSELRFDPNADYNGSAQLKITTNDQGHTGSGPAGGLSDSDTVSITVNAVNDAPVVEFTNPADATQTVDENKTTSRLYTYTVTDVDSANPAVDESCGSGSEQPDEAGDPQNSFRCLFPDGPASTTVSATADDGEATNNTGSDSVDVTVRNVAPSVTFTAAPASVDEDKTGSVQYSFSVSDPGNDTFAPKSGFPDCGTGGTLVGTLATTASGGSFECRFSDGLATPTVRMQVVDADEPANSSTANSNIATQLVTVSNVAPSVTNLSGPTPVGEDKNASRTYSFSVSDPGDDTVQSVSTSCGDNGVKVLNSDAFNSGTYSFQCIFDDGGSTKPNSIVSARATDSDGATGAAANFTVQLTNVAPTATFEYPSAAVNEGTNFDLKLSNPQDASSADEAAGFTYAFDCDLADAAPDYQGGFTSSSSVNCPADDGPATLNVGAKIKDKDDGVREYPLSGTASVTIKNVAPTADKNFPTTVDEGSAFTVSLDNGNDASAADKAAGFKYAFDCDGGSLAGATYTNNSSSSSATCSYPDGPSDHTVVARIIDKDGGYTEYTGSVHVNNVAPSVNNLSGPASTDEGKTETYTFTVSDPGDDTVQSVSTNCDAPNSSNGVKVANSDSFNSTTNTYSFECRFPDGPASATISAQATDSDGDTGAAATKSVSVKNLAPVVTLAGANPLSVQENKNGSETFSFTVSDSGNDPIASVETECDADSGTDDGVKIVNSDTFNAQNNTGSFKCTFPDGPADALVKVSATDDDGAASLTGSDSKSVTVNNVAPTVSFTSGPANVDEGTKHTYSYEVTDPGNDTFSVVATYPKCGQYGNVVSDSSTPTASGGSFECFFPDGPAETQVAIKVVDSDGASDTASEAVQVVAVANVAPSVTAPANQSANEGAPTSFSLGSFTDPGPDSPWSVDVDWGDGSAHTTFTETATGPVTTAKTITAQSHTYADNGQYTVTVKVTDKNGAANNGVGSATFRVDVANAKPVVSPPADDTGLEGTPRSFGLGSFSDAGTNDNPWKVSVDWGDGSGVENLPDRATQGPLGSAPHAYDDNGTYTMSVTVTDKDGGSDTKTSKITIDNVAPTGTLSNNGPIDEGGSATISFSNQFDPSGADTAAGFRYAYRCDGAPFAPAPTYAGAAGSTASTSCSFADNGTYTVRAAIIDKNDGYTVYTTDVVVNNAPPAVTAPANQSSNEGENKLFSLGSFSDSGPDSPWTVDVDWGDGSNTTFTQTATGVITAQSHTYADNAPNNGPYTVKVKVTDKDGSSDTKSFTINVANVDPTATNGMLVFDPVLGTATASFDFSDVGYLDKHGPNLSYFTWYGVGDTGTRPASVTEENVAPDATGKATDTRTLNPGCYNLAVTGTAVDDDGGDSDPLTLYSSNTQTSVHGKAFLPPIMDNERNIAKYGNVVPVKVQLTNTCTGGTVTNVTLYITIHKGSGNEVIEDNNPIAESVSSADTGSQMRVVDGRYMYNLSTRNMTANSDWTVRVRLGSTTGPVLLQAVLYPKK
jgi:hypothetical protein